ncbi:osteopetrosis-associated transmembrane protein 1 [Lutzomyia longipalpis]|uniref:osteopetrosis-associated transmembrane protein 1 n=1 Tax=Lutzomyia longipalpis TaxID=7200 RepID=UPI0024838C38|nr:osteopetrosis-associated transmembrane protein 1 [Lutzomyia longipalpis]
MKEKYMFVISWVIIFHLSFCQCAKSEIIEIYKNHISCETLKHEFQDAAKDFTTKILNNAVPVTYCNKSVGMYLRFEETYKNLTTHIDANNVSCKYQYFNVDRLGVVETMYNQLHSMWEMGFCDDCYANTTSATPSNTTGDFYIYWEHIHQCIENTSRSGDPCLMCMGQYQKLNDFYDGIKSEKNDRICFDLQDAMNRTRILWSVKLNCCRDRNSSMLTAYIIAGVVSFLPSLFYVFIYFNKRYHERYDFLSDGHETPPEEVENTANARDHQDHADIQAGPSRVTAEMPHKVKELLKERRHDDDEELLSSTPKKSEIHSQK